MLPTSHFSVKSQRVLHTLHILREFVGWEDVIYGAWVQVGFTSAAEMNPLPSLSKTLNASRSSSSESESYEGIYSFDAFLSSTHYSENVWTERRGGGGVLRRQTERCI